MSWLKRLLPSKPASSQAEADVGPSLPFDAPLLPNEPVAVIADIHGRADLLEEALSQISNEVVDHCIFVGDYVDRGDQSAEVLARLKTLTETYSNIICLKGNHEKMMLDFIDRPAERAERWLRNGGLQTLASYGIAGLRDTISTDDAIAVTQELRNVMPDGMEDWLRALPLSWNSGNLWVVHAGADPATPISEQGDRILLWGHRNFRKQTRSDGQWVVHGHTIVGSPEVENGRISIDTGAYATGRLTYAVVTPGETPAVKFREVRNS